MNLFIVFYEYVVLVIIRNHYLNTLKDELETIRKLKLFLFTQQI